MGEPQYGPIQDGEGLVVRALVKSGLVLLSDKDQESESERHNQSNDPIKESIQGKKLLQMQFTKHHSSIQCYLLPLLPDF